jgi:UDPglucose 6-dehydrogenase
MAEVQPSPRGPIGVVGLWHLGCVVSACLAEAGYGVVGVDPDSCVVEGLGEGRPPISEPGLEPLIGRYGERLRFSTDANALAGLSRAWLTFDTPVDDDDVADVEWVLRGAELLLSSLAVNALVIVSSQLPVGSVAQLAARCATRRGASDLRFACIPENLRLGDALASFRSPDRFVVGAHERDRDELGELLSPFGAPVEWMKVESAEMTKHALNGFLATSVAFINEVAAVCESVGADAAEVSRGLKSERRIGPRAYLAPGDAFAGGTLARDINFLRQLASRHTLPGEVFEGVAEGNQAHRGWASRKLLRLLRNDAGPEDRLVGSMVAVWGLTYKAGTDTLRRSSAIELCRWLDSAGAEVRAYDPAVRALPGSLADHVQLCPTALLAAKDADALVVSTPWPELREISPDALRAVMRGVLVLDAAGFLADSLGAESGFQYVRVGTAEETPSETRVLPAQRSELRS